MSLHVNILGWLDMGGKSMAQAYLHYDKRKWGTPVLPSKWRNEYMHPTIHTSVFASDERLLSGMVSSQCSCD